MWHKVAPELAEHFTVIAADLRGQGDSGKPRDVGDHSTYSNRRMACDQVELMSALGFENFYLAGHDIGARVAHRMTLDFPERVSKVAFLDIVPTLELYAHISREFALLYWSNFFLAQPPDLPERMIGSDPAYYVQRDLFDFVDDDRDKNAIFAEEALAEYIRCLLETRMPRQTRSRAQTLRCPSPSQGDASRSASMATSRASSEIEGFGPRRFAGGRSAVACCRDFMA